MSAEQMKLIAGLGLDLTTARHLRSAARVRDRYGSEAAALSLPPRHRAAERLRAAGYVIRSHFRSLYQVEGGDRCFEGGLQRGYLLTGVGVVARADLMRAGI